MEQSRGALQVAQVMQMILVLKPWGIPRITHPSTNNIMSARESQGLGRACGGRAGQGGAPAELLVIQL